MTRRDVAPIGVDLEQQLREWRRDFEARRAVQYPGLSPSAVVAQKLGARALTPRSAEEHAPSASSERRRPGLDTLIAAGKELDFKQSSEYSGLRQGDAGSRLPSAPRLGGHATPPQSVGQYGVSLPLSPSTPRGQPEGVCLPQSPGSLNPPRPSSPASRTAPSGRPWGWVDQGPSPLPSSASQQRPQPVLSPDRLGNSGPGGPGGPGDRPGSPRGYGGISGSSGSSPQQGRLAELRRAIAEREKELRNLDLREEQMPRELSGDADAGDRVLAADQASILHLQRDIQDTDAHLIELEARWQRAQQASSESAGEKSFEMRRGLLGWGAIESLSDASTVASSSAAVINEAQQQERAQALERDIRCEAAVALDIQDRVHWLRAQLRRQPGHQDTRIVAIQTLLAQLSERVGEAPSGSPQSGLLSAGGTHEAVLQNVVNANYVAPTATLYPPPMLIQPHQQHQQRLRFDQW